MVRVSLARDQALTSACADASSAACMLAVADAKANGNIVVRASNGQMFAVDPADSQILSGDPNLKAMLLEAQKGSAFGAILSALIIASGGSTETALEGAQLGQAVEGVGAGATSFGTPRTALPVEVKPGNATNKGPLTIAEQMGILSSHVRKRSTSLSRRNTRSAELP